MINSRPTLSQRCVLSSSNRCSLDQMTTVLENGDSHNARFSFSAFRFLEQQNETVSTYYLHCVTRLCEASACSNFKVRNVHISLSVMWKKGFHLGSCIYSNVATEGKETSSPAARQNPPHCPHQCRSSPGMRIVSVVVPSCVNEMRLKRLKM